MKLWRWIVMLSCAAGFADDQQKTQDSFFYTGLGVAVPFMVPGVNAGYRLKYQQSAFDFHGSVFFLKQTVGMKGDQTYIDYIDQTTKFTGLTSGVTYLRYIAKSPFYVGAGVDVGVTMIGFFPIAQQATPHGVVGYEGQKFFHQFVVSPATYHYQGTQYLGKSNETKVAYHIGVKF